MYCTATHTGRVYFLSTFESGSAAMKVKRDECFHSGHRRMTVGTQKRAQPMQRLKIKGSMDQGEKYGLMSYMGHGSKRQ